MTQNRRDIDTVRESEGPRDKETERHRDRETERLRADETDRRTEKQTDKQKNRQIFIETGARWDVRMNLF